MHGWSIFGLDIVDWTDDQTMVLLACLSNQWGGWTMGVGGARAKIATLSKLRWGDKGGYMVRVAPLSTSIQNLFHIFVSKET